MALHSDKNFWRISDVFIFCKTFEKELMDLKICFPNDGHDIYHLRRVCRYSINIARQISVDIRMPLLITGSYLHDLHRFNLDTESINNILSIFIQKYSINSSELSFILKHHDDKRIYPDSCIEFQIIQDADKLDRIGINGVVRAIRYGACHREPFFDATKQDNTLCHLEELIANENMSKVIFNTKQAYRQSKKLIRETKRFINKSKKEWVL